MKTCGILGELMLVAAVACGAGCAHERASGSALGPLSSAETLVTDPATERVAGHTLSDGNIVADLSAADRYEVQLGELALQKASDPAVKAFAQQMIKDHGQHVTKLQSLAQQEKVQPQAGKSTAMLERHGQEAMAKLQGLQGPAFDRAYIAQAVADHEMVLEMIDKDFMPWVTQAGLMADLSATRATVEEHLKEAEALQARLGKRP